MSGTSKPSRPASDSNVNVTTYCSLESAKTSVSSVSSRVAVTKRVEGEVALRCAPKSPKPILGTHRTTGNGD